jgi:hypothetical protein
MGSHTPPPLVVLQAKLRPFCACPDIDGLFRTGVALSTRTGLATRTIDAIVDLAVTVVVFAVTRFFDGKRLSSARSPGFSIGFASLYPRATKSHVHQRRTAIKTRPPDTGCAQFVLTQAIETKQPTSAIILFPATYPAIAFETNLSFATGLIIRTSLKWRWCTRDGRHEHGNAQRHKQTQTFCRKHR